MPPGSYRDEVFVKGEAVEMGRVHGNCCSQCEWGSGRWRVGSGSGGVAQDSDVQL